MSLSYVCTTTLHFLPYSTSDFVQLEFAISSPDYQVFVDFPNPESALDEEAGKQLLEDYEGYSKVSNSK